MTKDFQGGQNLSEKRRFEPYRFPIRSTTCWDRCSWQKEWENQSNSGNGSRHCYGVATAIVAAALLGMECEAFCGKEDTDRQALNVYRMELLGAKVHPVTSGTQTLKGCSERNHAGNGRTVYRILIMYWVL